jgi:predicted RNase H-like nuclease (RuvC/YqgF family)
METKILNKTYIETNDIARSPTLQTVSMVEKFIDENSGEYKKTELLTKELAIADKTIEELSEPLRELINGVKGLNKKSRKNKNLNN